MPNAKPPRRLGGISITGPNAALLCDSALEASRVKLLLDEYNISFEEKIVITVPDAVLKSHPELNAKLVAMTKE